MYCAGLKAIFKSRLTDDETIIPRVGNYKSKLLNKGSVAAKKFVSNSSSENRLTDSLALVLIWKDSSDESLNIVSNESEYESTLSARYPVRLPSCSTTMSNLGPPDLCAKVNVPAAINSTTPENKMQSRF